jgi:hypothetical protein
VISADQKGQIRMPFDNIRTAKLNKPISWIVLKMHPLHPIIFISSSRKSYKSTT